MSKITIKDLSLKDSNLTERVAELKRPISRQCLRYVLSVRA